MSDQDDYSRDAARRAAKAAAADVLRQKKLEAPGSGGAFALYIWGFLAIASVVFAGSAGLLPGGNNLTNILAKNTPARQPAPDIDPARELARENAARELALAYEQALAKKLALTERSNGLTEPTLSASRPVSDLDQIVTGSVKKSKSAISDSTNIAISGASDGLELGVDIGSASSIPKLVTRFSALQRRAPDLFANLQPRIQFDDTGSALTARLIAGPFESQPDVAAFCRSVKLRLTIDCEQAKYEGDKIALPAQ